MQDYETQVKKEILDIMNEGTVYNENDMNFLKTNISNIYKQISDLKTELNKKDELYGGKISTINNELDQFKINFKKKSKKLNFYRISSSVLLLIVIVLLLMVFKVF